MTALPDYYSQHDEVEDDLRIVGPLGDSTILVLKRSTEERAFTLKFNPEENTWEIDLDKVCSMFPGTLEIIVDVRKAVELAMKHFPDGPNPKKGQYIKMLTQRFFQIKMLN